MREKEIGSGHTNQKAWQTLTKDEAKGLPGYGFGGVSFCVLVFAAMECLIDVGFICLLESRFYLSDAQLPIGTNEVPWPARYFGLIGQFPPAFIVESLILLHILLCVSVTISTFQFNERIYKGLRYLLWGTPLVRIAFMVSDTLTFFPYFWNAHLIRHMLPSPPVMQVLLDYGVKIAVVSCSVGILELSIWLVLWRFIRSSKSTNLTYLSRRRMSEI